MERANHTPQSVCETVEQAERLRPAHLALIPICLGLAFGNDAPGSALAARHAATIVLSVVTVRKHAANVQTSVRYALQITKSYTYELVAVCALWLRMCGMLQCGTRLLGRREPQCMDTRHSDGAETRADMLGC